MKIERATPLYGVSLTGEFSHLGCADPLRHALRNLQKPSNYYKVHGYLGNKYAG